MRTEYRSLSLDLFLDPPLAVHRIIEAARDAERRTGGHWGHHDSLQFEPSRGAVESLVAAAPTFTGLGCCLSSPQVLTVVLFEYSVVSFFFRNIVFCLFSSPVEHFNISFQFRLRASKVSAYLQTCSYLGLRLLALVS